MIVVKFVNAGGTRAEVYYPDDPKRPTIIIPTNEPGYGPWSEVLEAMANGGVDIIPYTQPRQLTAAEKKRLGLP